MASVEPNANHLHPAPDRQPCQHLITHVVKETTKLQSTMEIICTASTFFFSTFKERGLVWAVGSQRHLNVTVCREAECCIWRDVIFIHFHQNSSIRKIVLYTSMHHMPISPVGHPSTQQNKDSGHRKSLDIHTIATAADTATGSASAHDHPSRLTASAPLLQVPTFGWVLLGTLWTHEAGWVFGFACAMN